MKPLFLALIALMDVFFASLVFKNNSKDKVNVYFAAFISLGVPWAIGAALMLYNDTNFFINLGLYGFMIAPLYISLFILFFAHYFPSVNSNDLKTHNLLPLAVVPTVIFTLLLILNMDWFIKLDNINSLPTQNIIEINSGYIFYSLYFTSYFVMYASILFKKFINSEGMAKKQILYVLWALFISTLIAVSTNLLLPLYSKNLNIAWIGPLSAAVLAVFLSRAIISYRLFDIKLFVLRFSSYVLTIAVIGLIYSLIVFGVGSRAFPDINIPGFVRAFYILFAFFVAVTFPILREFFNKLTEKIFYQSNYDPQIVLDEISHIIVGNINAKDIMTKAMKVFENSLQPEYALYLLYDSKGELKERFHTGEGYKLDVIKEILDEIGEPEENVILRKDLIENGSYKKSRKYSINYEIEILVRLSTNEEIVGYLILGPKRSGNKYTYEDVRMLRIVASELAVSLKNAQNFEEIQNFNVKLQKEVDDATKLLKDRNRRLVLLDQTKDDFISMASHQLRTPLTSVKGYLSMTLEGDAGELNSRQKKLLTQAFISSERMVYLIGDMLNVSRLKTGKFIIDPTPVKLDEIIETEISQLGGTAKARGLDLKFEKPEDFPTLMLDETKIRQVIMNFVDNAIYYTPSGGEITVKLVEKPETIELTVTDTGIGVPKEERHHLFTKFFRAKNAKKARPDGTGLGLFMAKKVIIAQGGGIIFHSQEGKGSTFGFTFPKETLQSQKKQVKSQ